MAIIDSLAGAAGSAVLQRTFMLLSSSNAPLGIPIPLLVCDAIMEEHPEYNADVTQHPVEAGKEVTDHIQLKNATLRLKGVLSDSPLDLSVSIANAVGAGITAATSSQSTDDLLDTGLQAASGIAGAALQGGGAGNIASAAAASLGRGILVSMYKGKLLIDIVTKRGTYQSMAIQSLRFPRDQSTGHCIAFEMDLTEVRIVTAQTTILGKTASNVSTSATSVSNLGSQATSSVSSTVQSVAAAPGSILRSILGK